VLSDGPDAGTAVDTGFIVLNLETYPLFLRLLQRLGVLIRKSDMSFGYHDQTSGLQYASHLWRGIFAQATNLLRPSFLTMLRDIVRFNRAAGRDLDEGWLDPSITLGQYLDRLSLSRTFVQDYITPMGSAIWSMPQAEMLDYPAATFVRFFKNHGLLQIDTPLQWYTVDGGSHTYVRRFLKEFSGNVRLNSQIKHVRREATGVRLVMANGIHETFDKVVLATHADQSLKLLADPSPTEAELLGAWRYSKNQTVLHTDTAVLPPLKNAWASWNYRRDRGLSPQAPASLTYDMNRLQGLSTKQRYLVTLNPARPIRPDAVVREMVYHHPVYTIEAIKSQDRLHLLNTSGQTFFCGSYFGYGFHEDAVRSAVEVGHRLGVEL